MKHRRLVCRGFVVGHNGLLKPSSACGVDIDLSAQCLCLCEQCMQGDCHRRSDEPGWLSLADQAAREPPKDHGEHTIADDVRLLTTAHRIGTRGRALLQALAERLAKGAEEHGDFPAARSWTREALEEHLDAVVYLAIEAQEIEGRK